MLGRVGRGWRWLRAYVVVSLRLALASFADWRHPSMDAH